MANSKETSRFPELREFVKEHDQKVYDFCSYLLPAGMDRDDLVLSIFREFGAFYRRMEQSKEAAWEPLEVRLKLFQFAWDKVREMILHTPIAWSVGRDTRQMKGLDEDWLKTSKYKSQDPKNLVDPIREQMGHLDADFRAPVVLRDILHFEDEEVMRVLGLRWGVYRHRLHRGRLELKDGLRGRPSSGDGKAINLAFHPNPT